MSLNSAGLDAFYCCAQVGHFTRAAHRLHITQSALSQRIKNLESQLGSTLIIRERSGLRLTEAGEQLLRYCQTKDQLETEVVAGINNDLQQGPSGKIRIGGFSSILRSVILPTLSPLIKEHPQIQIKLITRELYELRPLLKSGEIDFMILDQDLAQEGYFTHLLGYEKNIQVQKHGFKAPDIYLDHDEEDKTTFRYLKKKTAVGLQRRFLDDIYGIIDGVRLGIGRAIVPLHMVQDLKDIEIVDPEKYFTSPVVLHYYQQPFYSKLHLRIVKELTVGCPKFLN